jgi:uncharacterized protein YkwD
MARIRILLVVAVAICAVAATASTASAMSPEALMMHKVTHYRRSHGLGPVHLSGSLRGSAAKYARHLMRTQYFGHARRIHASHRYRRLGEILELQRGGSNVGLAFRTWLRSSPHRAIILDGSFNFAGAGRAYGRFRGYKSTIWVMHFGRP